MTSRLSPDAHAELLSVVLDTLRKHHHVVHGVTIHPTGEIELRLDPSAASQEPDELEAWRARKRRRARQRN